MTRTTAAILLLLTLSVASRVSARTVVSPCDSLPIWARSTDRAAFLRHRRDCVTRGECGSAMEPDPFKSCALGMAVRARDYRTALECLAIADAHVPDDPSVVRHRTEVLIAVDDLARLDRTSAAGLARSVPAARAAYRSARGDLARVLLRWSEADSFYTLALAAASDDADRAAALAGRGSVRHHLLDFEGSRALFDSAVVLDPEIGRYQVGLAEALIRLGRVREAIAILRETIWIDPYCEEAHYYLGNGYSDVNYSELPARCPTAFPASDDSVTQRALAGFRERLHTRPDTSLARDIGEFAMAHRTLAEPWVMLGTLSWSRGESDEAVQQFLNAFGYCQLYGRAHNGLAKALEQKRLAVDAHAAANESLFATTPTPRIPGIDRFVVNYAALTPRQQKRVALSIQPWAAFVPVLNASGATYYIKPLDQRLSDSPHTESLRDQRIDYDSRLWDDVRGCGGHYTVTGVEDVERTVRGRYNTVLHELTHQVHTVLPPDVSRRLDDLYAAAKARAARGEDAFVSRYQSSSVYEYFAEGMNSYSTPTRDAYDVREITRERLAARDPGLVALIDSLAHVTDVERCYAPALAAAAGSDISDGDVASARAKLREALHHSASDENALTTQCYAQLLAGATDSARATARTVVHLHPESADAVSYAAFAEQVATRDVRARIAELTRLRGGVRAADAYRIDQDLADAYLAAGQLRSARAAARRVLDHQADDASALSTLGTASSLAGQHADARDAFRRAIAVRNGVVRLRMEYAAALIRAGDFAAADTQLAEARLLAPGHYAVETIAGWLALARGDIDSAAAHLTTACAQAPWSDLAAILKASAQLTRETAAATEAALLPLTRGPAPSFVYLKDESFWTMVHTLPASERVLLNDVLARCASLRGQTGQSARLAAETSRILHDD